MEENYMGEKKSKKGTVFIIVLLILIILGLVGYICYDKGLIFKTEKEVVKKEKKAKEKSVEFTDEELDKYVNYISPSENTTGEPSALLFDKDSVDADELDVAKKIVYIGGYLSKKETPTSDYQYHVISESDVKAAVEEVYGPDTYEKTTFNLGCGDYILRENEGKYYTKTGCGGTTTTTVSNVVIDYKATKKKLEITTAYVFLAGIAGKIYKDYNQSVVLDNYTDGYTSETQSYLDEYVKKNKDKLNHIVYTFESKDGKHYYFKGFKNNK